MYRKQCDDTTALSKFLVDGCCSSNVKRCKRSWKVVENKAAGVCSNPELTLTTPNYPNSPIRTEGAFQAFAAFLNC